ncbi:MAG: ATP-binding protein, partial [Terricaulis sp.]
GGPHSVFCIVSDVTDRLSLEEQLKQSQRLDAIGQLTGGVAHDFNNLLTVVLGNSEALVERLSDQPALRHLAQITLTVAERGAELTHRLLAFSRRQALEPRSVDANQLLSGMVPLLKRTLAEDIEITFVPGAELWPAVIDPSQLEGAVLNLCINARDAMSGGGRLTVETENVHLDGNYAGQNAEVAAGDYVMVAVSDTGVGIPSANLGRVFDPFFTTKEIGKGTGLGLSMVYGFVKQSGGHVKIYSEVGIGTVVKLYLPRSDSAPGQVVKPERELADLAGTEKILLVEDDDLVRAHAESILSTLGYRVIVANDGPSALEIMQRDDTVELLFTDVVMPGGMTGRVLADRAIALRPNLRVLYTSGYTQNSIVHDGRVDEGVLLLSKPYSRLDLAQKVRAALDRSDK